MFKMGSLTSDYPCDPRASGGGGGGGGGGGKARVQSTRRQTSSHLPCTIQFTSTNNCHHLQIKHARHIWHAYSWFNSRSVMIGGLMKAIVGGLVHG